MILPTILLLLGGIVLYNYVPFDAFPRTSRFLHQMRGALREFHSDFGRLPTTEEGIHVLVYSDGNPKWNGPYLKMGIDEKDILNVRYEYLSSEKKVRMGFNVIDGLSASGDELIIEIEEEDLTGSKD